MERDKISTVKIESVNYFPPFGCNYAIGAKMLVSKFEAVSRHCESHLITNYGIANVC